jgi:invasion protein IalB
MEQIMQKLLNLLILYFCLALPFRVGAQGLPLSAAEIKLGDVYTESVFGPWEKRCIKAESEPNNCHMFQVLTDATRNPMVEVTMFNVPQGGQAVMAASIMTPLETLLTAELQIQIEGEAVKSYPYSWCNKQGCVARIGFTKNELNFLSKGTTATIFLTAAAKPTAPFALEMSLIGFTKALESLAVR